MILTKENYFSKEASMLYMGSSQFKSFMQCPAKAMAEIEGRYKYNSDAFLAGQYLDAHFEKTLSIFKRQHPEMLKADGDLQKLYQKINNCINVIEDDPIMNKLCSGEQQKILTGEIAKVPFKIMIDSFLPDRTVDRKCMRDFKDKYYKGEYVPWWYVYRYDIQATIYWEIRRQNGLGDVPFELVAISKEDVPDKAWIRFKKERLEENLKFIEINAPRFQAIKEGLIDPEPCGECDYCRSQKMLTTFEEV